MVVLAKHNRMVTDELQGEHLRSPGADFSISYPVGQDFLEKCVHPDTFSWRTDFPPIVTLSGGRRTGDFHVKAPP